MTTRQWWTIVERGRDEGRSAQLVGIDVIRDVALLQSDGAPGPVLAFSDDPGTGRRGAGASHGAHRNARVDTSSHRCRPDRVRSAARRRPRPRKLGRSGRRRRRPGRRDGGRHGDGRPRVRGGRRGHPGRAGRSARSAAVPQPLVAARGRPVVPAARRRRIRPGPPRPVRRLLRAPPPTSPSATATTSCWRRPAPCACHRNPATGAARAAGVRRPVRGDRHDQPSGRPALPP